MQKRAARTSAEIGRFNVAQISKDLKEIGSNSITSEVIKQINDLEKNISRMKLQASTLMSRVGRYRLGGFKDWNDLVKNDAQDSDVIKTTMKMWYEQVVPSYERLRAALESSSELKGESLKPLVKKWDQKFASITWELDRVRSNYERFNSKRVGAFLLASYIDPGTNCKEAVRSNVPF